MKTALEIYQRIIQSPRGVSRQEFLKALRGLSFDQKCNLAELLSNCQLQIGLEAVPVIGHIIIQRGGCSPYKKFIKFSGKKSKRQEWTTIFNPDVLGS